MTSKTLDGPYKAECFEVEGSAVSLRVEGSATGVGDGSHGVVGLLLPKLSTNAIDAGISVLAYQYTRFRREAPETVSQSEKTKTKRRARRCVRE